MLVSIAILVNTLDPMLIGNSEVLGTVQPEATEVAVEEAPPEVVVEPTEDENLKTLIESIQVENNLNENNFAFFIIIWKPKNIIFIIKIPTLLQQVQ